MSTKTRAPRRIASAHLATGLLALAAMLPMCAAFADPVRIGPITVDHPWSRATPPAATTGAGYLELSNSGSTDDRLVSASSPAAAETQIHEMTVANGVMTMRQLAGGLAIPTGSEIVLKPGGYHVMLIDLKRPLKAGEDVPVTLRFEKAGSVDVALHVEKLGSPGPAGRSDEAMQGHDMDGMAQ